MISRDNAAGLGSNSKCRTCEMSAKNMGTALDVVHCHLLSKGAGWG